MKITYLSLTDIDADNTLSVDDFHDGLTTIVAPNRDTAELLLRFLRDTFCDPNQIERPTSSVTGQVRLDSPIDDMVIEPGRPAVLATRTRTNNPDDTPDDPRIQAGPSSELFAQPANALRDPESGPLARQLGRLFGTARDPVADTSMAALANHRQELEDTIDRLVVRMQQADTDLLVATDRPLRATSDVVDLNGLLAELEQIDGELAPLTATIDDYSSLVEIAALHEEAAQSCWAISSSPTAGVIDLLLQDDVDDPLAAAERIIEELDRLDAIIITAEADLARTAGEKTRADAAAELVQRAMRALGPEDTVAELEKLVRNEQERRKRLPELEKELQQHQERYAASSIDVDDLDTSSAGSFDLSFEKSIRLRLERRERVHGLREELTRATDAIAQHEISTRHLLAAQTELSRLPAPVEVERRASVLRLLRPALQALDERHSYEVAGNADAPNPAQLLQPHDQMAMLLQRWAQPSLLVLSALFVVAAILLVIVGQSLIAIGFGIASAALVGLAVAAPGPTGSDERGQADQTPVSELLALPAGGNLSRHDGPSLDVEQTAVPDLERHVRTLAEQIGIPVPQTAAGLKPYERELESIRAAHRAKVDADRNFERSEIKRTELEDRQVGLVDQLELEQSAEAAVDEHCSRWLTSQNINVDTDRVGEILERLRNARRASEAIELLEQERRRCAAESVVFNRNMTELWDAAQPGTPAPDNLVTAVRPVHQALQTALRRLEHEPDAVGTTNQIERNATALRDATSNYEEFVAGVGSGDRDEIRDHAHSMAEDARIRREIAEATQRVADRFEPEVLVELAHADTDGSRTSLHASLEEALDQEDQLLDHRAALVETIRKARNSARAAAANAEETVSLRMGVRMLATQLEQVIADWRQAVIALELVDAAVDETERRRCSKVFDDAARLFSMISDETCRRMTVAGDSIELEDDHGQVGLLDEVPAPLATLVALAIRLSALRSATTNSVPSLPVVLDDVIATGEPACARPLADYIASLATKTQVIVVTTQKATADLLLEAAGAGRARTMPLQQLRRRNSREVLAGATSPATLPPVTAPADL